MKSEAPIDVRAAIEKNSYLTSVADLERRGKRQVKVIKTSLIYSLIEKAVKNVRESQGKSRDEGSKYQQSEYQQSEYQQSEYQQMVKESKEEFDRLLGEHENLKNRLRELEETNDKYESLNKELSTQVSKKASRLESESNRFQELQEKNNLYETQVKELNDKLSRQMKAQSTRAMENEKELLSKIHGLEEALKVARQVASDRDAKLTEECKRLKKAEESRSEDVNRLNEIIRRREQELEKAENSRKESEEYRLQIASLTAEMKAMRENQPAAENLLNELKGMRDEFKSLENRNRELEIQIAATPQAPVGGGVLDADALEKVLEKKMSQITSQLSAKLEGIKHGVDVGTSPEDIKMTIKKIFSDEIDGKVDSNIGKIKVKEKKSKVGISDNLKRLKSLGLSSEGK